MIKEVVLRDFPNWTPEKQLSEFQAYKKLGGFSPFSEVDYALMEMVMNNPNAEISVQCEDGVCGIVKDELDELIVLFKGPLNEATKLDEPESQSLSQVVGDIIQDQLVSQFIRSQPPEIKQSLLAGLRKLQHTILEPGSSKYIIDRINEFPSVSSFFNNKKITGRLAACFDNASNTELLVGDDKLDFTKLPTILNTIETKASVDSIIIFLMHLIKKMKNIETRTETFERLKNSNAIQDETDNENHGFIDDQIKILSIATEKPLDKKTVITGSTTPLADELKRDYHALLNTVNPNEHSGPFDRERGKENIILQYLPDVSASKDATLLKLKRYQSLLEKMNKQEPIDTTSTLFKVIFDKMQELGIVVPPVDFKSISGGSYVKTGNLEFITAIKNTITGEINKLLEQIKNNSFNDASPDYNDPILMKRLQLASVINSKTEPYEIKALTEDPELAAIFNVETPSLDSIPGILNKAMSVMQEQGLGELVEKLMRYEKKSEGRGEKFIEFVFPYALSGGQQSFDIRIGRQSYEVKTYISDGKIIEDSIRLGQEGNIFKSEKYVRLFGLIMDLKIVFDEEGKNYDVSRAMMGSALSKKIADSINNFLYSGKNGKSLLEQIRKGELSHTNIDQIGVLLNTLKMVFTKVQENDFYFLKIFLKNDNIDLIIEPITPSSVENLSLVGEGTEIKFKISSTKIPVGSKEIVKSAIMRILGNTEIINRAESYLLDMIDEGMTLINAEFQKHPMIILYDHKGKAPKQDDVACVGVYTHFKFTDITQNGFKVIPAEMEMKSTNST